MKYYYYFYCRIYNWYNTDGKKDKDTLRVSAIALLSGLPCFNILTIIFWLSLLNKHTFINPWAGVLIFGLLFIVNLSIISSKKSVIFQNRYASLPQIIKKRINSVFYMYLIFSIFLFIFILAYTAYFKNKYGNYDLGMF